MNKCFFLGFLLVLLVNPLDSQSFIQELIPNFETEKEDYYYTDEIILSYEAGSTDFIGVSCFHYESDLIRISYRIQLADKWSAWQDFSEMHEYIGDTRRAYEAKPITSSFYKIQFKSSHPLNSNYKFRFFYSSKNNAIQSQSSRSLNCSQPDFCDRICWCPSCPVDSTPQLTDPTHIIVHHSAGFNESNNFASVVEYYWDLHVNTNGWDDIGYNWLIDPNGVIYQGRLDNYQGAHFSCINENTIGICMIGDYTSSVPSQEAINALVDLVGFEATEHQIDVLDESYHETGDFIIHNVSGHRDGNDSQNGCSSTVCPGDSFYPMLGDVRTMVSELDCYQDAISDTDELTSKEIKIYPSPFINTLFIESEKTITPTLKLINSLGQIQLQLKANTSNDTSALSPGLYFVLQEGKILNRIIKL